MTQVDPTPFLARALRLACQYQGECAPNPPVGAVLVDCAGQVIAEGMHCGAGTAHAERHALSSCTVPTRGSTLYVTLEPCCHTGRTPPCTQAIIAAGIQRVVYAHPDPDSRVCGKGHAQLVAAGIVCVHFALPQITALYRYYTHWQRYARPWVSAKLALSLDGKIAGPAGRPVPLTGVAANDWTHQQRQAADGILTTVRTIHADDPQLNVRLGNTVCAKPLYVLDTHLSLSPRARVMHTARSLTVFHAQDIPACRQHAWEQRGVTCIPVPRQASLPRSFLAWDAIFAYLGEVVGLHHIWVEAGGRCIASLLNEKKVHTAYWMIAPVILGENAYPFRGTQLPSKKQPTAKIKWQPMGNDSLCVMEWSHEWGDVKS